MVSLARDLIGEIRLRGNIPRKLTHRDTAAFKGAKGGFSSRAKNLWRVGQGSNAAVLKKIGMGGTHTRKQLSNQLDYLFSKSAAIFGNMVEHDPEARSLTVDERSALAEAWADGWGRDAKNGQTTHLLLSFPADLSAKKALHIAEIWAAEMFQAGNIAFDEWSYVAALHTDRVNPHVHIIVNNRGLDGEWFYMAKDHDFNLVDMKERMVQVAAEMGVSLDASSRLERGILTYGPSRAEIEDARRENRPVREKVRTGRALSDALDVVGQSAETLRSLASLAMLTSLDRIASNLERAAEILESGGIVNPEALEIDMDVDTAETRRDIDRAFTGWLDQAEKQISTLEPQERREMRRELSQITAEIMRDLGDDNGAELAKRSPRSELYQTELADDGIKRGDMQKSLTTEALAEVRSAVLEAAESVGIDRTTMQNRLETPAANAWQEREWVKQDLVSVSKAQKLDLDSDEGRNKAADLVDNFYAKAAKALGNVLESEQAYSNDRLARTLGTLAEVHREHGKVEFSHEEDAARFASDLKDRYGENVLERIAQGDDRALSADFPDAEKRREISRALVAAAESHESIGLSLQQIEQAREKLAELEKPEHELRHKDHDLDL